MGRPYEASEAVSGAVAAPEMAVSERRGLSGGSPAQCGWGRLSLLVLLLGGCSGRIHRLALTVRPAGLASLPPSPQLRRWMEWLHPPLQAASGLVPGPPTRCSQWVGLA